MGEVDGKWVKSREGGWGRRKVGVVEEVGGVKERGG